jgi:hypothetical protein
MAHIREFFEAQNVQIHEWGKVRTDWLTLRPSAVAERTPDHHGHGAT